MKQDRLYFLGNILGGIAKGALKLGKKLVSKIKDRREKKVNKAAAKLLKQKEKLADAENLIAETGSSGAGVSGYGQLLQLLQKDKSAGAPNDVNADNEGTVTLASDSDKTNGGMSKVMKIGLIAVAGFFIAKALKIIK